MTPGAPATCRAAVRAIWLARPATRVSKVRAGFRRLRLAGLGAAGARLDRLGRRAAGGQARSARGVGGASSAVGIRAACWRGTAWAGALAAWLIARCSTAAALFGREGRARAQGRGLARGQRQLQPHRLAGEFAQHGLDAGGVLGPDPVQLEAVGHAQADTAPASPSSMTSAGGRGRIQVVYCCSGSSVASRSQPRCQRSMLMWTILLERPHSTHTSGRLGRGYPQFPARGQSPRCRMPWCKCLTRLAFLGLIVGFPNAWVGFRLSNLLGLFAILWVAGWPGPLTCAGAVPGHPRLTRAPLQHMHSWKGVPLPSRYTT
jgi:hypothetical protein